MAMLPHFGPSDRDNPFSAYDLSGFIHAERTSRLQSLAEAEARFLAHLAVSELPPVLSSIDETKAMYRSFLTDVFGEESTLRRDFDLTIVASSLTDERTVFLTSIRQRSTGDLILPRPDDILTLNPARLFSNARHFDEDTFCGVLFDISEQEPNILVEATPVLLPRSLRHDATRFHNGDPDSLVGELLSRFARRELGGDTRFISALVADDESDDGLPLLVKDQRGREYVTKIVNPGGGLLHKIEFFIPLNSRVHPSTSRSVRSLDLDQAFRNRHERFEYDLLKIEAIPTAVRTSVENHLRSAFASCWRRDWKIVFHGAASIGDEAPHYHLFVTIEDRHRLRVVPSVSGEATVLSRKLGGLLVHVDSVPREGILPSIKSVFGFTRGETLHPRIEAWMVNPRVVAAEIERLANRPGESIFEESCRAAIELDLEKRGKSAPVGEIRFGPFSGWSHPASSNPLRAIVANHRHGRHLISFAFDERYGVMHPDSDIRVEGFFPA